MDEPQMRGASSQGMSRYGQAAAESQTIEKIASAGRFNGRRATPEERSVRYMRRILRDGIEHEIPKSMALYLLDGHDKAERLAQSCREHPALSYTGHSAIWRETRAGSRMSAGEA